MSRRITVLLALVSILMAAMPLLAQAPSPFSADMKFTFKGMTNTGKLYFSGSKVRMEMSAQGQQSIVIVDTNRNVADVLMPTQHMYMETSTDAKNPQKRGPDWRAYNPANPCAGIADMTCQKIGTEMADNRMCDKWLFAGKKPGSNQTVWIDQKNGIPIQTETADGVTELFNIKQGPQDANLFEIPAGYQKFDVGNMMKGMMRGQ